MKTVYIVGNRMQPILRPTHISCMSDGARSSICQQKKIVQYCAVFSCPRSMQMGMLRYLQGWIGVVGFIALGNTVSCFTGHILMKEKIYTVEPNEATALAARLFGVWTLLSGILRIGCAFYIENRAIYNLTFASFILAFLHFFMECVIYKTAELTNIGVLSPLFVSVFSVCWMSVGYAYLPDPYRKKGRREEEMTTYQKCRREQETDYSYLDAHTKHRRGGRQK